MSENGSLDTENDTFEGVESREIANNTTTLPTTTLLNSQQVKRAILSFQSRFGDDEETVNIFQNDSC